LGTASFGHQSALGADSFQPFGPDTRGRVHERCRRGPQGAARWRPGQSTRKRTGTGPCSPLRCLARISSRFGYSRQSFSIARQKPSMPSFFAGSLPPSTTWNWMPSEAFAFSVSAGGMVFVHGERWARPPGCGLWLVLDDGHSLSREFFVREIAANTDAVTNGSFARARKLPS